MSGATRVVSAELLKFCQRIENIQSDIDELNDDKKVVYAEVKAAGLSTKAVKHVVKLRKMTGDERDEHFTVRDLYEDASGLHDNGPLFRFAAKIGADTLARDALIAAAKLMVPPDGEMILNTPAGSLRVWRDGSGDAQSEDYKTPPVAPAPEKKSKPKAKKSEEERLGVVNLKAFADGKQARRAGKKEFECPLPPGDARRADWKKGWDAAEPIDVGNPDEPAPDVPWAKVHGLGKAARADGKTETDNPFPADDKRHARWITGWNAGAPDDDGTA